MADRRLRGCPGRWQAGRRRQEEGREAVREAGREGREGRQGRDGWAARVGWEDCQGCVWRTARVEGGLPGGMPGYKAPGA